MCYFQTGRYWSQTTAAPAHRLWSAKCVRTECVVCGVRILNAWCYSSTSAWCQRCVKVNNVSHSDRVQSQLDACVQHSTVTLSIGLAQSQDFCRKHQKANMQVQHFRISRSKSTVSSRPACNSKKIHLKLVTSRHILVVHDVYFGAQPSINHEAMEINLELVSSEVASKKRKGDQEFVLACYRSNRELPARLKQNRVKLLAGPGGLRLVVWKDTIAPWIKIQYSAIFSRSIILMVHSLLLPLLAVLWACLPSQIVAPVVSVLGASWRCLQWFVWYEVDMMASSQDETIKLCLAELLGADSASSASSEETSSDETASNLYKKQRHDCQFESLGFKDSDKV